MYLIAGSVVLAVLILSLAGIVLARMLRRSRPATPATATLSHLEPWFAGAFAAAFVAIFVLGMISGMSSSWVRQQQVIDIVKPPPANQPVVK